MTTGEVAKLCNVTIRTVIKWFETGKLDGYRIPGSRDRRFPRDKVVAFMTSHGIPLGELAESTQQRKRVLIVDDDRAVVVLLSEFFEAVGLFDYDTAFNGYEAGLKTFSFKPHLMVLDYNLGDITGAEVAAQVRNSPEVAETKILVMSGFLSDEEASRLLDHGVDDYLRKPFDLEKAREKIFQLLGVG